MTTQEQYYTVFLSSMLFVIIPQWHSPIKKAREHFPEIETQTEDIFSLQYLLIISLLVKKQRGKSSLMPGFLFSALTSEGTRSILCDTHALNRIREFKAILLYSTNSRKKINKKYRRILKGTKRSAYVYEKCSISVQFLFFQISSHKKGA